MSVPSSLIHCKALRREMTVPSSLIHCKALRREMTVPTRLLHSRQFIAAHSSRFRLQRIKTYCATSVLNRDAVIQRYEEEFRTRMEMAGLKPHHRIAIGVSGGPDSMALCALMAKWKSNELDDEFVDGLLAIVVDHGLREESTKEAYDVSRRVCEIGIRCEIASCSWPEGKPIQGHLQEAARTQRFKIFQKICMEHKISVLFIAHHADDQAELFIIRSSRSSGVLGLSGMAFTSQIFPSGDDEGSLSGILVVRPLLNLSKHDLYTICEASNIEWVEDPTNQSSLYARNRIRKALKNLPLSSWYEIQSVIAACRRTRTYVEQTHRELIQKTVIIKSEGYAVVDLDLLNPSQTSDLCLSKFISSLLQFISQRNRPIRGNTSRLLLNYFRSRPCKTSITGGGCYLCPSPGSKGTKILVCCSVNCPLPFGYESLQIIRNSRRSDELDEIIRAGKQHKETNAPFLNETAETVLLEGERLAMVSKSTCDIIESLKKEEREAFRSEKGGIGEAKTESSSVRLEKRIVPDGEGFDYMGRFLVKWRRIWHEDCAIRRDDEVIVRGVEERDWVENETVKRLLNGVPVAARRSLPALVASDDQLLSIPIIGFCGCSCISASCEFSPRTPLGGGYLTFC